MSEVLTNTVPTEAESRKVAIPQRIPTPSPRILEKIADQATRENDKFDVIYHKWMDVGEKAYDKKYASPQLATEQVV